MNEVDLDLVGVLERLVALAQRPLDIDAVGHVVERHQGGAVGERHRGAIDHAAVAPFEPVLDRRAIVDGGDDGAQRLPGRVIAVQRPGERRDLLDVRAVGELLRREPPHAGEGGIVQAKPAVAREHGDTFREIVEGLALNADQLLEAPLELEPLGHVGEQIGHAAVRVRRGDDAQGAAVGQMPGMVGRLDGAIAVLELRLPLPEVAFLRQLARDPQFLQQRRIGRALIEIGGIEIPQRAIGGVVERQFVFGVEHGDAGRQRVERAAVGIDHAGERAAHRFRLGGVDAEPGAAGLGAELQHVETAPCAGDDGGQPAGIGAARAARLRDGLARGAVEQFQMPLDGVAGIARLDRARIGGIDEIEPPGPIPRPHRRRQPFDQRAQRGDLAQQCLVTGGEIQQLAFHAARVLEAQHGAAGDGAAVRFDRTAGIGRERHGERLAAAPQRFDGLLHRLRLGGIEPTAEGEHAARRGDADDVEVALDAGLIGGRRPIDDHLRLGLQQGVGAVEIGTQRRGFVVRLGFLADRARARPHQNDRGDDGEQQQTEDQNQRDDRVAVEAVRSIEYERAPCKRRPLLGAGRAGPEDGHGNADGREETASPWMSVMPHRPELVRHAPCASVGCHRRAASRESLDFTLKPSGAERVQTVNDGALSR